MGNSAGGHLCAMAANCLGETLAGTVAGLVTVSGVFDMEPLRRTAANTWLHMDVHGAIRNSPMLNIPSAPCPATVIVGGNEPDEFRRQSASYAEALRAKGGQARFIEVAGENHFSIIERIGQAGNPVSDAVFDYLEIEPGRRSTDE